MISVVVCTYNGSARLRACLTSIICQDSCPNFEILVVDNASTDGSGDFCRVILSDEFATGSWQVINEPQAGLLHARIRGMKSAQYDWVLFCDDDNILLPDFLTYCEAILSQNSEIGVLGSQGEPKFLG